MSGLSKSQIKFIKSIAVKERITANMIVEKAKPKDSPIHNYFCWDNDIAGEKYRLYQAREMIRKVHVYWKDDDGNITDDPTDNQVRMFYAPKIEYKENGNTQFISVAKIMNDKEMRHSLLEDALCELEAFKYKYKMLSELKAVFDLIDGIITKERKCKPTK